LLINPGDRILVEAPTYLGALQAFNLYGAEYLSIPCDEDGLRTDLLEAALRSGPKFMYVLPNFQNPGGTTLSADRRHALVLLADRYGIPIIEDDPYGQLRYEGKHLPPLVVLDRENVPRDSGYTLGNVIYLSTFSKTLAPGLRLGWMVAPPEVIAKLVQLKQGADLHTSTFAQIVAYEIARENFLDEHVKKIRSVYRERRDVMLESLTQYFPPEVTWTRPKGGLFLWVMLPNSVDANELLHEALRQNVAFVPGDSFFAPNRQGPESRRHFRLNFSHARPNEIREGIDRLGLTIKTQLMKVPAKKDKDDLPVRRRLRHFDHWRRCCDRRH
jgi:2-aminoadipate transaminase